MKSGTSVVQSSEQARLLPLEYRKFKFSLRTHDTYVKRVSQRSAESREFSPGTPVSSSRVGWD